MRSEELRPKLRGAQFQFILYRAKCRSNQPVSEAEPKKSFLNSSFLTRRQPSIFSTAMNASPVSCTVPNWRIRFLPSFCFSSSFFLRVMSPP